MDRRTFLKRGLLGGALLVLGGAGIALVPTKQLATPLGPLKVVDERDFQILVAIASRIVVAPGANPVVIAQGVDKAISFAVPEAQKDLKQLLCLFENALPGLLLDGRFGPFTRLSAEAQDKALESWRTSCLTLRRSGYQALRKLCLAVHYGDAASWPSIHYNGPPDVGGFFHEDSRAGTPQASADGQKGGAP